MIISGRLRRDWKMVFVGPVGSGKIEKSHEAPPIA
jgi:hypothetical protein